MQKVPESTLRREKQTTRCWCSDIPIFFHIILVLIIILQDKSKEENGLVAVNPMF